VLLSVTSLCSQLAPGLQDVASLVHLLSLLNHNMDAMLPPPPCLRSVLSLNNPQNIVKQIFLVAYHYEVAMLKIIIIIIVYTLNNFPTTHMTIS